MKKLIAILLAVFCIGVSCIAVSAESTGYILGDIDGDGDVDITDATFAQNYVDGTAELDEASVKRGDVNHDKVLDMKDVDIIAAYVAGEKVSESVGEVWASISMEDIRNARDAATESSEELSTEQSSETATEISTESTMPSDKQENPVLANASDKGSAKGATGDSANKLSANAQTSAGMNPAVYLIIVAAVVFVAVGVIVYKKKFSRNQ